MGFKQLGAKLIALPATVIALTMGSTISVNAEDDFRQLNQPASSQFLFKADSISAQYFSREVGQDWDQMQFWPHNSDNPTHLIGCIEEGLQSLDGSAEPFTFGAKLNPGVQIVDLRTREVNTILRGISICDGIRTTPWGTVIATEEDFITDAGGVYEMIDPVSGYECTVLERGLDTEDALIVDQDNNDCTDRVVKRNSFPVIRYEGLIVHHSGAMVFGDEERPGSYADGDTDGGAIYKFIPDSLRSADAGPIASLSESPIISGTNYALRSSCRGDRAQIGQGCEIGSGDWMALEPTAKETGPNDGFLRIGREAAAAAGATGFYRPEDMHIDPMYVDEENPNAVRFCFANTGNRSANNFGEVQCAVDQDITTILQTDDGTNALQVVVNRFIEGDSELNQPDNLAFQPRTGILYVIEDNPNGDIWACLPDGDDRDIKSDGCIRLLTLADPTTEPTGLIFTNDGRTAYFNIQHSSDNNMPLVDDFRTDDLIILRGFKPSDLSRNFGGFAERRMNNRRMDFFGF